MDGRIDGRWMVGGNMVIWMDGWTDIWTVGLINKWTDS